MSSLLHYTVYQYIKRFEKNDAGTEKVSLPLPDPSDMSQAKGVNFDELGKELVRIKKDFEGMWLNGNLMAPNAVHNELSTIVMVYCKSGSK